MIQEIEACHLTGITFSQHTGKKGEACEHQTL
jgi:hypothetical protein